MTKTIRVAALTSGENVPSSRFRVRQFVEPLRARGVEVSEQHLSFSKYLGGSRLGKPLRGLRKLVGRVPGVLHTRTADVTWLERELLPGRVTLEGLTKRPRLFDVDDALWLKGKAGFSERIAALCDGVVAGNAFLADHYRTSGARVWVVPTSIDTDLWRPLRRPDAGAWTMGWIGTGATLPYLVAIEAPLARFLRAHDDARLLVVSDEEPRFSALAGLRWRYEKWSAAREVQLVQEMDVGLMPLPDTEWARGKCSCKMLSYMSVGIPVVASPFGTNGEILGRSQVGLPAHSAPDWLESLNALFSDQRAGAQMGAAGRELVEREYSVRTNAPILERIFRELTG